LSWDLGETKGTVALRIPNQDFTLALLKDVGPLAVSSANLTGEQPANDITAAENFFGEKVWVYLDAGPATGNTPSTIVDLTEDGKVKVVRLGSISVAAIKKCVGKDIEVVAV
jgi:tRNA threonylcarbamoyl adenosine modification protein (Sua5/YciO/YrdC/YwlC family)